MESLTADPDTQVEVDLMILDYLLCMAIDQVLSPGNGGETQYAHECDISWSLKTINTIKAALLPSDILPKDMQIKTQILELAQLFSDGNGHPEPSRRPAVEPSQGDQRTTTENRSPIAQSERRPPQLHQSHENDKPPAHNSRDLALNRSYNTLVRFVALCGTAVDNLPDGHADTTAKLITEAALNDYHMAGAQSPGRYRECIEHVTACLREDLDPHADQANLEYLSTLLPPIDLLLDVSEGSGQTSSLGDTTTRLVHRFLTDLMKTLDPPILIQLERGRLGGLSREETQQLKDRIGF
ncbi:hypothetical protein CBS63078_6235 [Aspergillus niger]|uniref:Uncharacterized protein n=4 Tax=Aspergillus TaxID=5052 RepID=A2QY45_ASPNC|nr:uncharacterized protein BO96DRAFT_378297 [Aspergillus niger CBS 101883]XP_059601721.1 hypothetical protein An11g11270 [Aspergillus niger]RDH23619.1 hypothetical protein M747DRAFT_293410 [Aspergillus niger ATCC 13496]RDK36456.1 hypothetical protein M752DRAFT_322401 [Aspergillus phoenicis ATCC 13157]KAI2816449.1 hypothetical protein CBS115989_6821 [Aspergillus niger]KAI2826768.1 hypothetical protein CBS133816_7156 [Aspergillus niger]KAI2847649.1 hypothetical protein CBS11350_3175 [Aspergillu